MKTALSLHGSVKATSVESILKDLYQRKATGELSFTANETNKKIYFKNGLIVYSSSNLEKDRLGNVLLEKGIINLDQFYE